MASSSFHPRYWIHELASSVVCRIVISTWRLLAGRPRLAEEELIRHLRWMVRHGVTPTLMMAFFYGLLAVYLPASFFPKSSALVEFILPHFGGFFTSFLVPFAVANLFCVRGVVALASELTGMRGTQELDILDALGLDVARELFAPRALAIILPAPFLAILAIGAGALGAWLGSSIFLHVSLPDFWTAFVSSLSLKTCLITLLKTLVISFVLAIVAGAHAFAHLSPGAREPVGLLTTAAVGVASLSVTILNLIFRMAFP
jgi:ABC-type transporter Mla maintaining outer membrane lipid asymmetry permease subunit MlaE